MAHEKRTKKNTVIPPIRVEGSMKDYFEDAAHYDNRSLTSFVIHAALEYAKTLKTKGWKAKRDPEFVDYRKAAA